MDYSALSLLVTPPIQKNVVMTEHKTITGEIINKFLSGLNFYAKSDGLEIRRAATTSIKDVSYI